jgi:hypothetical protein
MVSVMSIPVLILAVSSVVSLQATPTPAPPPPGPVTPSGVPVKPPARERQVRNEEIYKPSSVKVRSPELEGSSASETAPAESAEAPAEPAPAPAANPAPATPVAPPAPMAAAPAPAPAVAGTLGPSEIAVLGVLVLIVLAPMVLGVWWVVSSRADASNSQSI